MAKRVLDIGRVAFLKQLDFQAESYRAGHGARLPGRGLRARCASRATLEKRSRQRTSPSLLRSEVKIARSLLFHQQLDPHSPERKRPSARVLKHHEVSIGCEGLLISLFFSIVVISKCSMIFNGLLQHRMREEPQAPPPRGSKRRLHVTQRPALSNRHSLCHGRREHGFETVTSLTGCSRSCSLMPHVPEFISKADASLHPCEVCKSLPSKEDKTG